MTRASRSLTSEVVVACSYCGEYVVVPFRVGAVMPMWAAEVGVRAYMPTLDGGDHACQSERHRSERAYHERWAKPTDAARSQSAEDHQSASAATAAVTSDVADPA